MGTWSTAREDLGGGVGRNPPKCKRGSGTQRRRDRGEGPPLTVARF